MVFVGLKISGNKRAVAIGFILVVRVVFVQGPCVLGGHFGRILGGWNLNF